MNFDLGLVLDLLISYDDNCQRVERHAMRALISLDIAVFNGLRDITPTHILTALRRMESWFGKVRTVEHALCLVILTDYISCSYNQRTLYKTFENAITEKFVDSLFLKLYWEWSQVFETRHLIQFTDSELKNLKSSLSRSVDRFKESFKHKDLLNRIVQLCENYENVLLEANLQNINYNSDKSEPLQGSSDKFGGKNNYHNDNSSNVLSKKRSSSDMMKYLVHKKHISEERSRNEILIDSPSQAGIDEKITRVDLREVEVNEKVRSTVLFNNNDDISPSSRNLIDDVINICDCCDDKTNHLSALDSVPVPPAPKKLNAFDILMKKVTPRKKRLS